MRPVVARAVAHTRSNGKRKQQQKAIPAPDMPRDVILRGHVLDVLRGLPDESVHCVITSPPYYGLRSYDTEPQVWGGDDPTCEHEWGQVVRTPWANEISGPSPNVGKNGASKSRQKERGRLP